MNIDGGRIGTEKIKIQGGKVFPEGGGCTWEKINEERTGRFPANIILDEEAGQMLDEQSGESKSTKAKVNNKGSIWGSKDNSEHIRGHNDKGGASRFFYCA